MPDRHILLTGLVMGEVLLGWRNSTLPTGDARETVARLKQQSGLDLIIMGSGELTQSLMQANLIDGYVLLIRPLVLGTGRRLFAEGESFTLRLTGSKATGDGVVIATYRPGNQSSPDATEHGERRHARGSHPETLGGRARDGRSRCEHVHVPGWFHR